MDGSRQRHPEVEPGLVRAGGVRSEGDRTPLNAVPELRESPEEPADVGAEQVRLLHGGEVAAEVEL
ncbi:hypothetical protein GCM10023083_63030 [Streptomyces phyllanthi]